MDLHLLGWSEYWEQLVLDRGELIPVRIIERHRGRYRGIGPSGAVTCLLSGKLQFASLNSSELPSVGDWCLTSSPYNDEHGELSVIVQTVLPRKSWISRIVSGNRSDEQVLAANVDYTFIVSSLNEDLSTNRIQRYILLARQGQTVPVVVLSKADLCEQSELEEIGARVENVFQGLDVILTSAYEGLGLEKIGKYLCNQDSQGNQKTGVFVGSSGVGKSALINALMNAEVQKTASIREADGKGRHTTSAASILFLPDGGNVIDTPGLREVQVFGEESVLKETFSEIEKIGQGCRFDDCLHSGEAGCAVSAAVENGLLDSGSLENYRKLQAEMEHSNRKLDKRTASNSKKRWKDLSKEVRRIKKILPKRGES